MSKQQKKFCKITKYLEKQHKPLYELIDDLSALGAVRARRGHAGVSFIIPSKDTIKKLDAMRYTDNIEEVYNTLLAHIVHDFLPTAAAWNAKKSDIPNGLNKKIEVASVKGDKVVLADGAELELDTAFKTFDARPCENQAVWKVVKGALDHSKHTKPATNEHALQGARPVRAVAGGASAAAQVEILRALRSSLKHTFSQPEEAGVAAIAPFAWLCSFAEFVEKSDQPAHVKVCSQLLHSAFTPVSNLIFAISSADGSPLRSIADQFESELRNRDSPVAQAVAAKVQGRDDYMELCARNFEALRSLKGGGADKVKARDVFTQLHQVVEKTQAGHLECLRRVCPDAGDQCGHWFAALATSRKFECDVLCDLEARRDSPEFSADVADMVDGLFEVVQSQSSLQNVFSGSKADVLTFLSKVLEEIRAFAQSPYCCYPLGDNADPALFSHLSKVYRDESLRHVLKNMDAEQLAKLIGSL